MQRGLEKLMAKDKDDFQTELLKPKMGFLISSGITAALAMAVYFLEEQIRPGGAGDTGITFAFILIALVLAAIFLLLCYRQPHIGNRLMGYHKLTSDKETAKSDVQFTAGFKSETAVDEKRMNTKRKQARHSRKKLAAITREMQQKNSENPELSSEKAELDSKNTELNVEKAGSDSENR